MVLHQHDHGHGHGHGHGNGNRDSHSTNEGYNDRPHKSKKRLWRRRKHVDDDSTNVVVAQEEATRKREKKENRNINVRAAFIHVIGDLIQSIGVVIAGYIIRFMVSVTINRTMTSLYCYY